jgi:hypothetical protein
MCHSKPRKTHLFSLKIFNCCARINCNFWSDKNFVWNYISCFYPITTAERSQKRENSQLSSHLCHYISPFTNSIFFRAPKKRSEDNSVENENEDNPSVERSKTFHFKFKLTPFFCSKRERKGYRAWRVKTENLVFLFLFIKCKLSLINFILLSFIKRVEEDAGKLSYNPIKSE